MNAAILREYGKPLTTEEVATAPLRDRGGPLLALQVLVYPMTDPALTSDSASELACGYLTTTALLELGWHVYLDGRTGDPYTAPAATP